MTKFKVGDKVRVIDVSKIFLGFKHYYNGMETEVVEMYRYAGELHPRLRNKNGEVGISVRTREIDAIELIPQQPRKQTKSERITALEAEAQRQDERILDLERKVAELQRKVSHKLVGDKLTESLTEAIEKAPSPNEQRKAIIAEAKAFVAGLQVYLSKGSADRTQGNYTYQEAIVYVKFQVNTDKRAVTALVHSEYDNSLLEKALAKAHPDDVFNVDIGKAIAIGRALGLDVKRFEKAVQPTEVVVGMTVYDDDEENGSNGTGVVDAVRPEGFLGADSGYTSDVGWAYLNCAKIIDDTGAQY